MLEYNYLEKEIGFFFLSFTNGIGNFGEEN